MRSRVLRRMESAICRALRDGTVTLPPLAPSGSGAPDVYVLTPEQIASIPWINELNESIADIGHLVIAIWSDDTIIVTLWRYPYAPPRWWLVRQHEESQL